jgi:hypothetical protein
MTCQLALWRRMKESKYGRVDRRVRERLEKRDNDSGKDKKSDLNPEKWALGGVEGHESECKKRPNVPDGVRHEEREQDECGVGCRGSWASVTKRCQRNKGEDRRVCLQSVKLAKSRSDGVNGTYRDDNGCYTDRGRLMREESVYAKS